MIDDLFPRAQQIVAKNPGIGRERLAKMLGCGKQAARTMLVKIKSGSSDSKPPESGCSFSAGKDEAFATSVTPHIRTVDQLLEHTGVDRNVWDVERFVVNKWPTVMREPATTVGGAGKDAVISTSADGSMSTLWTRKSSKPLHEQMIQIKVWLKRKAPHVIGLEAILKSIEAKSPMLDVPRVRKLKLPFRRSFELCIMDPHLGLLCDYPEADAPQDLKSAASLIMTAIDDLVERAKTFGPFEEAFMPFGNDFTHTDTVFHTTTAGTGQPEAIAWHKVYELASRIACEMVSKLRQVAKRVHIYQIPGNHSRMADFTLGLLLKSHFRTDPAVVVDASSSPYKFHRYGVNLIGFEHGHSVKPIRLAALMANERREDWSQTEYREFHLGDQHRKGSSKPSMLEEQGVSVEYIPGLTAPNEWHRLKSFSHQKRGAMAFVWDYTAGPIARFQFNISQYSHKPLK